MLLMVMLRSFLLPHEVMSKTGGEKAIFVALLQQLVVRSIVL
jgi:hypothetical protein